MVETGVTTLNNLHLYLFMSLVILIGDAIMVLKAIYYEDK